MNRANIPQWASDLVVTLRGGPHAHADLDPRKTALVVIDLQNAFLSREHASIFIPEALDILPNVNRIAAEVRRGGGKVFWVQNTVDEKSLASWSAWFGMLTPAARANAIATQSRGTPGHAIHSALDVKPEDQCVEKYRFSAFIPEGSDLAERLRRQGYDTVIIAGAATNICCETSARDASMLNFKTIMVSDATATIGKSDHTAALTNFYVMFGDVMDTDFLVERLRAAA